MGACLRRATHHSREQLVDELLPEAASRGLRSGERLAAESRQNRAHTLSHDPDTCPSNRLRAAQRAAGGARLAVAAAVFFSYVLIRRIRLPRGRDLRGALLFGVVQFGLGFGLGYWALVRVPASIAGVLLAGVPLFTLAFAVVSRVELPTVRGLVGALISIGGIAVILGP